MIGVTVVRSLAVAMITGAFALSPVSSYAQSPPTAAPTSDLHQVAARDLALALFEKERMGLFVEPTVDFLVKDLISSNSSAADLNKHYPGLDVAFRNVLRPILNEELSRRFPDYISVISDFYAQRMTTGELNQVRNFVTGETGQILIGIWSATMASHAAVAEQLAQNSGVPTSAQKAAGTEKAIQNLSPQQLREMESFSQSLAGQKFLSGNTERKEIEARWANEPPSPALWERIERELSAAADAHVANFQAEHSPEP